MFNKLIIQYIILSGAKAVEKSNQIFGTNASLPFLLDDVGCSGSETNLLNCLPQHNCHLTDQEDAGVQCLRKGMNFIIIQHFF